MIQCEHCGTLTPSNTRTYRIPVKYRTRRYEPFREYVHFFIKNCEPSREHEKHTYKRKPNQPASTHRVGFEIVREMTVCSDCVEKVKAAPPSVSPL